MITPPEKMDPRARDIWTNFFEGVKEPKKIDLVALEAYCGLVARLRQAQAQVAADGPIIDDGRGRPVAHPGIQIEMDVIKEIKNWGSRFADLQKANRSARGYLARAVDKSVKSAVHLHDPKFAASVAVLRTLAFLIDDAESKGAEALMRASFGSIPTFLKTCAELQITPASIPVPAGNGGSGATTEKEEDRFASLRPVPRPA